MNIGQKVLFTPEVVTVKKGTPVEATIEGIGIEGDLRIVLADGTEHKVSPKMCKLV